MKSYKALFTASILACASTFVANQASALAACRVNIVQVSIDESTSLLVSTSGDAVLTQAAVCKLNAPIGTSVSIDPKSCEKWHALFLAALLSRRSMEFIFTGDSCPTFPDWFKVYTSTTNQLYYVGIR